MKSIYLLIFLLSPLLSSAEWENKIYKEGIETVQCYKLGNPLDAPVILLDTYEKIAFEFDDLNIEQSNYYYSIIHCDANWEESNIAQNVYMQGFNETEIYQLAYSFNTLQDYTHFSLELPNEDVEFLVSGNYILKVFEGLDQEKLVISQRFMIYENIANVKVHVKASSVVADRDYKQEVDFNVNIAQLKVYNAFDEVKVVVMQNHRWDNAIYGLQPKFIKGNELVYDFEERSSFEGGNEYRNFDIKDVGFQSDRIAKIVQDSSLVHIILHRDEKRTFKRYSTIEDLNGDYLIKNDRAYNSALEADYFWVYFSLDFDFPLQNEKLYVGGQFSNYTYNDKYELHYDFDEHAYETRILLKQGYYNFAYIMVPNGESAGQTAYIEGSHYQTRNDYSIIVYYKDSDRLFDRIIAYQNAVSSL